MPAAARPLRGNSGGLAVPLANEQQLPGASRRPARRAAIPARHREAAGMVPTDSLPEVQDPEGHPVAAMTLPPPLTAPHRKRRRVQRPRPDSERDEAKPDVLGAASAFSSAAASVTAGLGTLAPPPIPLFVLPGDGVTTRQRRLVLMPPTVSSAPAADAGSGRVNLISAPAPALFPQQRSQAATDGGGGAGSSDTTASIGGSVHGAQAAAAHGASPPQHAGHSALKSAVKKEGSPASSKRNRRVSFAHGPLPGTVDGHPPHEGVQSAVRTPDAPLPVPLTDSLTPGHVRALEEELGEENAWSVNRLKRRGGLLPPLKRERAYATPQPGKPNGTLHGGRAAALSLLASLMCQQRGGQAGGRDGSSRLEAPSPSKAAEQPSAATQAQQPQPDSSARESGAAQPAAETVAARSSAEGAAPDEADGGTAAPPRGSPARQPRHSRAVALDKPPPSQLAPRARLAFAAPQVAPHQAPVAAGAVA